METTVTAGTNLLDDENNSGLTITSGKQLGDMSNIIIEIDCLNDDVSSILHPFWQAVGHGVASRDEYDKLVNQSPDAAQIINRIIFEYERRYEEIINNTYEMTINAFHGDAQEEFETSEPVLGDTSSFDITFCGQHLRLSNEIQDAITLARSVADENGNVEPGPERDRYMLALASIESQIENILSGR